MRQAIEAPPPDSVRAVLGEVFADTKYDWDIARSPLQFLYDAYRALRNPVSRIEHLLAIEGLPAAASCAACARATPPPLTTKRTAAVSARSATARAAASTRSSDCENPTLPAYITTRRPSRPCSAR